jgi:hypothetical protein
VRVRTLSKATATTMTDEQAEDGEPEHLRKRDAFKIAPVFR